MSNSNPSPSTRFGAMNGNPINLAGRPRGSRSKITQKELDAYKESILNKSTVIEELQRIAKLAEADGDYSTAGRLWEKILAYGNNPTHDGAKDDGSTDKIDYTAEDLKAQLIKELS
ncbi:hypothetical protein RGQ13_08645 [Thalassotalea psychrophila]|uniref:Uncharacterized protein n=1 Tax=Thalassotalea psychrophila TaxID=3065647 RepID=A0ABY9TYZ6_9GAMM|nr:hypothetical protein RGQ13_08645 [Colwelliaceae bacterium SQ149]